MFRTHLTNGGSIEKFLYKKYVNKFAQIKALSKRMYFQSELESNTVEAILKKLDIYSKLSFLAIKTHNPHLFIHSR